MRVRPKTVTKLIKIMKDPDPRYVSFVDHGANQTPFKVVKRQAPVVKQPAAKQTFAQQENVDMAKTETAVDETEAVIRSITFKKTDFPTISKVEKWLDDGGYEGFVITEKGDSYEVAGEGVSDEMFSNVRVVNMDTGIVAKMGMLVEDTGDTKSSADKGAKAANVRPAPQAKTKKADPVAAVVKDAVKKWDWWASYSANDFDLNGIVKAAMEDGIPPGMTQVVDAMTTATSNVLKAEELDAGSKQQALKTIGDQFGGLVFNMWQVFQEVTSEKAAKSAELKDWRAEADAFFQGTLKMNTANADGTQGKVKPKNPKSGEGDSPNDDKGAVPEGDPQNDKIPTPVPHDKGIDATTAAGNTGADTAAVKADEIATIIKSALSVALEPVTKRLDDIEGKVAAVKSETDTFSRRAPTKKATATAGGEEMIEDPGIAKKAQEEANATKKFERRMLQNAFGMPALGR